MTRENRMEWLWIAIAAAVLYGLHQVFTKLAAPHVGDAVGGLLVEVSAAGIIAIYCAYLWFAGAWNQPMNSSGATFSILTGICVGIGTICFFVIFQRGAPLSAVPGILAAGMAVMALAGMIAFREPVSWQRILGILLAIVSVFLLKAK